MLDLYFKLVLVISSSSNYSFSDDEDSTPFEDRLTNGQRSSLETNVELEQSLKRLALLDKTQEEIEKISKVCLGIKIKQNKPMQNNH